MGKEEMLAALNLEIPEFVPRTEYSAESHWDLVKRVTGIPVSAASTPAEQQKARSAFVKEWDYAFWWNILTHTDALGDQVTRMGHAVYASGGVDYNDEITSLFEDPEEVFSYDFAEKLGTRDKASLVRAYNENLQKTEALYPTALNMTGIYITLMSGMIEMLGWDTLLTAAGIDRKAFGDFTNRYADWIGQYFEALAASDSEVVMIHDDIVWTSGAFLHPDFYRTYIFPNYKKLFRPLHEAGKKILYTSDGNFTEFIDDIAACGVSGFVMEPCTDMAYVAEKYGKTHVFVGNADTRILLSGSKEDIENEVRRCMAIGKSCPGFVMAVGNHIPSNTPVENALWYDECVRKYGRR